MRRKRQEPRREVKEQGGYTPARAAAPQPKCGGCCEGAQTLLRSVRPGGGCGLRTSCCAPGPTLAGPAAPGARCGAAAAPAGRAAAGRPCAWAPGRCGCAPAYWLCHQGGAGGAAGCPGPAGAPGDARAGAPAGCPAGSPAGDPAGARGGTLVPASVSGASGTFFCAAAHRDSPVVPRDRSACCSAAATCRCRWPVKAAELPVGGFGAP